MRRRAPQTHTPPAPADVRVAWPPRSAKYPQPLANVAKLTSTDTAVISFQVADAADASHLLAPEQAVVRFHSASHGEVTFPVAGANGRYSFELVRVCRFFLGGPPWTASRCRGLTGSPTAARALACAPPASAPCSGARA